MLLVVLGRLAVVTALDMVVARLVGLLVDTARGRDSVYLESRGAMSVGG